MATSVSEWYSGRSVFITGGTGFIGKVLLEKLLRTCPEIHTVYLLCRPKRGLSPSARVLEFFKLPLFEKIRSECPEVMKKVIAVEGDLTKEDLGIVEDVRRRLESEVSVLINSGASVRLEADLKTAVDHNTTGTLRVLNLATKMIKLEAFIHLSTAFCHGDLEVLEEKLYPPPANPHDIIRSTQWMDQDVIDMITPKLLGCHPNCYTYSKRLAESLVEEYASRLPACVMRPSIVTPIIQDPVRGWVDTLNGPVGVLVGAGKGVIRSMLCDGDKKAEMVPVDIVANSVIVAATQISTSPRGVVSVFNVTSADKNPYSWSEVVEKGKQVVHEYPFEAGLWYPNGSITMNPYSHALTVLMVQTIPAYLIDLLMIIIRQKRFMVRVQRRIADGTHLLKFFTTRKWNFINKKALGLVDHLNERDQKIFYMGNVDYDVEQYFKDMIIGSRIYCMKEPLETLEKARRQLKMLYILDIAVKCILVLFFLNLMTSYLKWISTFIMTENNVRYLPVTIN